MHLSGGIPAPYTPSRFLVPLLYGGVTVFSQLVKHGAGPGKSVRIIGIGGLGRLGILFTRAFGDRVVGISRISSKRKDAIKGLGANSFIATDEDKKFARNHSPRSA